MIETYPAISDELKSLLRQFFGESINTTNQSNLFKIIYPVISNLLKKYEELQNFIDGRDIYKAEGLWLDYLLSNFNFIRKQPASTTVEWTTNDSVPNTIVNVGELSIETSAGYKFTNTNSVNISGSGIGLFLMVSEKTGSEYNIDAGTLTEIITPVSGINTGTNPTSGEGGQSVETDFEFRTRFLLTGANKSYWNIDGLYSALFELDGVTSVFVTENDSASTVGILPPHSVLCVVDGGENSEIATTIFEKSDQAIEKSGNTTVQIEDIQGEIRDIKFYRPSTVNIEYQFSTVGDADTSAINNSIKEYLDNSKIKATISTYLAIKYIENLVDLTKISSIDITFRRQGDTTYLSTLTLDMTEKASGVLL